MNAEEMQMDYTKQALITMANKLGFTLLKERVGNYEGVFEFKKDYMYLTLTAKKVSNSRNLGMFAELEDIQRQVKIDKPITTDRQGFTRRLYRLDRFLFQKDIEMMMDFFKETEGDGFCPLLMVSPRAAKSIAKTPMYPNYISYSVDTTLFKEQLPTDIYEELKAKEFKDFIFRGKVSFFERKITNVKLLTFPAEEENTVIYDLSDLPF